MTLRRVSTALVLAATLACVPLGWSAAADASKSFDDGQALLAKGDFDGALQAFKAAAEAAPDQPAYMQEYALLRRIVKARTQLTKEQDPAKWLKLAQGVQAYYTDHRLTGPALELATEIHAKQPTAESAEALADAQLAAGKDEDAAKLLADTPAEQRTPRCSVLQGIALAHLGRGEDARSVLAKVELPKEADARLCYDAARLNALLGNDQAALDLLKVAFEATPGPALEDVRAQAKGSPDFVKLVSTDGFATVLKTESKVKAACGSKEACGKCPSKGKHTDGKCAEEAEKDKK